MNRFDMEQLIMQGWSTKEDLIDILWKICDSEDKPDEDALCNMLIGAAHLHDVRMERLFSAFRQMLKEGSIK